MLNTTQVKFLIWFVGLLTLCFPVFGYADVGGGTTASSSITQDLIESLPTARGAASIAGYFIDGDAGRFREDRVDDISITGGLQDLVWSSGMGVDVTARALADKDYILNVETELPGMYYVNIDGRRTKKYYDGSNEMWVPATYGLTKDFADLDDDTIHIDRFNGGVEVGGKIFDWASFVFGYTLWTRDGKETLLRASQTTMAGQPSIRSIPALSTVNDRSDTFFVALPMTFNEKHDVEVKQSVEYHRGDQDIKFWRYASGALDQARQFKDVPKFRDFRTSIIYESFITDNVYVNSGYLFDYLVNKTTRESVRPNRSTQAQRLNFVSPKVKNRRISNTANFGTVVQDVLGVKGLQLRTGVRTEIASTNADSSGLVGGTTLREQNTALDEWWFAESVEFIFKGIPNTTIAASADLEQRNLRWDETTDIGSHEIGPGGGDYENAVSVFQYNADISHRDVAFTIKAANRPHKRVRVSGKYRMKEKFRDYGINKDNSARYYPGILGDMNQHVQELSSQVDLRLYPGWDGVLKWQYINDEIGYSQAENNAQQLTVNRLSTAVSGMVTDRLSVLVSSMVENYQLDTPTNAPTGSNWEDGQDVYDYDGDHGILTGTVNFVVNNSVSLNMTIQETLSMGDNKNKLFELWTGIRYLLNDTFSFSGRYEFFNFRDEVGGGFDDYHGHGFFLTAEKLV